MYGHSIKHASHQHAGTDDYIIGFDIGGGTIRASLYQQTDKGLTRVPLTPQGDPKQLDADHYAGIVVTHNVAKKRFRKGKENILADIKAVVEHITGDKAVPIAALGVGLPCRFESEKKNQVLTPFEGKSYVVQQDNSGMDMADPPSDCWKTNWATAIKKVTGIPAFPLNDGNMALLAHHEAAINSNAIAADVTGYAVYLGACTGLGASVGQCLPGGELKILHNAHMYDAMVPIDKSDIKTLTHICGSATIDIKKHKLSEIDEDAIFVDTFPKKQEGKSVLHLIEDGTQTYVLAFQLFAASSISALTHQPNLKTLTKASNFQGQEDTLRFIGKYLGRFISGLRDGKIVRAPSENAPPMPDVKKNISAVLMGGGAFSGEVGECVRDAALKECKHIPFIRPKGTSEEVDICAAAAHTVENYIQTRFLG